MPISKIQTKILIFWWLPYHANHHRSHQSLPIWFIGKILIVSTLTWWASWSWRMKSSRVKPSAVYIYVVIIWFGYSSTYSALRLINLIMQMRGWVISGDMDRGGPSPEGRGVGGFLPQIVKWKVGEGASTPTCSDRAVSSAHTEPWGLFRLLPHLFAVMLLLPYSHNYSITTTSTDNALAGSAFAGLVNSNTMCF